MSKPRIGCYAVYEPTEEGWEDQAGQSIQIGKDLENAGLEVISAPEPVCDDASCERVASWFRQKEIDLLHAFVVTWSFDHFTVRIHQKNPVPIAIRSIPGIRTGSLVGGEQLQTLLYDLEIKHKLFFGSIGDPAAAEETAAFARACEAKKSLAGACFGVIGRRTHGMTPIAVDEVELLRLFGIQILNIGLDELLVRAQAVDQADVDGAWKQISSQAKTVTCSTENAQISMRNFLAIKDLVQVNHLQALSIGSYPYCLGNLCLPIALLNDEGIPTGCESDINSAVAMFILHRMTGIPVHFGEMLDVDEELNTIVSSHCGAAAPSLANPSDGYILCPVRIANDGVCVRFPARTGPVTYVNLVGRKGNYRMCAFEGEAIPTGMVFEGNPLKLRLNSPFRKIWQAVTEHGFGHHWMTAYGELVPDLQEFCRITGIEGVFPDIQ